MMQNTDEKKKTSGGKKLNNPKANIVLWIFIGVFSLGILVLVYSLIFSNQFDRLFTTKTRKPQISYVVANVSRKDESVYLKALIDKYVEVISDSDYYDERGEEIFKSSDVDLDDILYKKPWKFEINFEPEISYSLLMFGDAEDCFVKSCWLGQQDRYLMEVFDKLMSNNSFSQDGEGVFANTNGYDGEVSEIMVNYISGELFCQYSYRQPDWYDRDEWGEGLVGKVVIRCADEFIQRTRQAQSLYDLYRKDIDNYNVNPQGRNGILLEDYEEEFVKFVMPKDGAIQTGFGYFENGNWTEVVLSVEDITCEFLESKGFPNTFSPPEQYCGDAVIDTD